VQERETGTDGEIDSPRASTLVEAPPCFPAWFLPARLVAMTISIYWLGGSCTFVNYGAPDYVTANPCGQFKMG